jgi:hypothetical protein
VREVRRDDRATIINLQIGKNGLGRKLYSKTIGGVDKTCRFYEDMRAKEPDGPIHDSIIFALEDNLVSQSAPILALTFLRCATHFAPRADRVYSGDHLLRRFS